MGIDLECAATFGALLTIIGDTYALISELNQKDSEDDNKDDDKCNSRGNQKKDKKDCDREEDEDKDSDNEQNGVILGTFISFLGDLISAIVESIKARQEYDDKIPKYVEKRILGAWLMAFGDILEIQSLIEEANKGQENQTLEISSI